VIRPAGLLGALLIFTIRFNARKVGCFGVALMGLFKVWVSFRKRTGALLMLNLINNILSRLLMVGYGFRQKKGAIFNLCKIQYQVMLLQLLKRSFMSVVSIRSSGHLFHLI